LEEKLVAMGAWLEKFVTEDTPVVNLFAGEDSSNDAAK
jgi:hypothetical protein